MAPSDQQRMSENKERKVGYEKFQLLKGPRGCLVVGSGAGDQGQGRERKRFQNKGADQDKAARNTAWWLHTWRWTDTWGEESSLLEPHNQGTLSGVEATNP